MIITLFFVALIAFAVYRKFSDDAGFWPAMFGVGGLAVSLFVIIAAHYIGVSNSAVNYYRDKAQIAAVVANPNATGEERLAALNLGLDDNALIQRTRLFRSDPFIGWFQQAGVGDLPLLDLKNIPIADAKATIKIEQ